IRVVQNDPKVADLSHAGVHTGGRLAHFHARIAEDAFFRFAAVPVEIHLLVWTAGDTHAPALALFLTHQDDTVFSALINRSGRAGGDAARIQTVIAHPRKVDINQLLEFEAPPALVFGQGLQIRVVRRVNWRSTQI